MKLTWYVEPDSKSLCTLLNGKDMTVDRKPNYFTIKDGMFGYNVLRLDWEGSYYDQQVADNMLLAAETRVSQLLDRYGTTL